MCGFCRQPDLKRAALCDIGLHLHYDPVRGLPDDPVCAGVRVKFSAKVLVLWFLAVLLFIFAGIIYSIFRSRFRLFRYMTAVVSVGYILLSLSHVDAGIAAYNISGAADQNDIDIYYLTDMLSQDAAPQISSLIDPEKVDDDTRMYLTVYFENMRGTILNQASGNGIFAA